MTRSAPQLQLINNRSPTRLKLRHMIKREQLSTSAIDTHPITFLHDPFLPQRRMTMLARHIDWLTLRVVDHGPNSRVSAIRSITLAGTGVPSSIVVPSPRTCNTTSVLIDPTPSVSSSSKASACC